MTVPYIAKATPLTPMWWPAKEAGESRQYALDVSEVVTEQIYSVGVGSAPSGPGELDLSNFDGYGAVFYLRTSGGQPTRIYQIRFTVQLVDGQILRFIVHQAIPPGLPGYPIPEPPSTSFEELPLPNFGRYDLSNYDSGYVYAGRIISP
jgi:hypothetical protein